MTVCYQLYNFYFSYGAIKRLAYSEKPHANQVVNTTTLQKNNKRDILQKILMQINCKLGGELWAVKGMYFRATFNIMNHRFRFYIFFAKLHNKNILEYIELYVHVVE